jgi:UDP-N-acetylglucosamine acyltransferase
MTNNIHKTAIIADTAQLGHNLHIGPYCVIGPNVTLGDHVHLKSHVVVEGITSIGNNTQIFPFASIGQAPQDKKYAGEDSKLIVGCDNVIREYVSINTGTAGGGMVTVIGNNSLFMTAVHIAHDCKIGNNVVFANCATLAGHVEVGNNVVIGGLSAVHQYVRIGNHAMIGGMSAIEKDIIPFGLAMGERANLSGINIVGLKRRGFSREDISAIRNLYDMIFDSDQDNNFMEHVSAVASNLKKNKGLSPHLLDLIEFINNDQHKSRSICKPKNFHAS